jgi:hypothetical protein
MELGAIIDFIRWRFVLDLIGDGKSRNGRGLAGTNEASTSRIHRWQAWSRELSGSTQSSFSTDFYYVCMSVFFKCHKLGHILLWTHKRDVARVCECLSNVVLPCCICVLSFFLGFYCDGWKFPMTGEDLLYTHIFFARWVFWNVAMFFL